MFSGLLLHVCMIKCFPSLLCALWNLAVFSGLISVLHRHKIEIRPMGLM